MKRALPWIGVVLLIVPALGAEPTPKPVKETWDAVYIEGAKAGYFHTTVREIERDGQKLLACTQAMSLGVKREGKVVTLRVETGDEETPDGAVVGVSLTQYGGDGKLTQTGRVEDGQLVLRTSASEEVRKLPWDDSVIGLVKQDRIFADKKAKPGDQFTYLSYEPTLQVVTTVRVTVKEPEEVDVLVVKNSGAPGAPATGGQKAERVKKKLLRAEVAPDKVKVGGRPLRLPALTVWLDGDLRVVRSETEQPGLGKFTVFRTTQAVAEEEGAGPALLPDLLINNLIPLNQAIDHPESAKAVVYRITLKGDDDPVAAFTQDARQKAGSAEGDTFNLRVRAVREPKADAPDEDKPGAEYLKSTYFLDCGCDAIKDLAKRIVGDETDAWRKALRIEKWVHDHMKVTTAVDYVPASRVAEDLRGDCRQHAMLAAALCRAAGLPARTALGLVYDKDPDKGPVLAFHMWTEVWVGGQWMGIDAVWGEGGVGADHIKITDHAWADTDTLAPLGAVTRVMGKVKVEVVEVK
jgi:transglutaminase-like putative cysteine protease